MSEKEPDMTEEELEKTYPSIDLAYEIALDSYESIAKRLDALDGRIQTLLTFSLTLLAAIPTSAKLMGASLNSCRLIVGAIFLGLSICLAFYARFAGAVKFLDVRKIYENHLHLKPVQFKIDIISCAQLDQNHNKNLLKSRWDLSVLSLCMFTISLVFVAFWLAA